MKYRQPLGVTDPNAPHVNGDIALGQRGSRPDARAWNAVQLEIQNAIDGAGLTPDHDDNTQLLQAMMLLGSAEDIVNQNNTFTKAQRGVQLDVPSAEIITLNFNDANNFSINPINVNFQLANPTNQVAGQSGIITTVMGATAGRLIDWGSHFKFVRGEKPQLTAAAGARDTFAYYVAAAGHIHVNKMQALS